MKLESTPFYFPIDKGIYEVAPGLRPLKWDFQNGNIDSKIFQLAEDFQTQRENKIHCRKERISKYICEKNLKPEVKNHFARLITHRLCEENPYFFKLSGTPESPELQCLLSKDTIVFHSNYSLKSFKSLQAMEVGVIDNLDALGLQFSEDIALTCRSEDGEDWISYLNLCSPSHWAAEDKIGLNFAAVHAPIPGIERILKNSKGMVEAMINKGPFQRFIWSFVTDTRLNHHPVAPTGWSESEWKGRSFNLNQTEPFYLRIERQTTLGQPEVQTSLFTIRIYFIPASFIKQNENLRTQLLGALESMTPESRVYKGVANCFEDLTNYLKDQ